MPTCQPTKSAAPARLGYKHNQCPWYFDALPNYPDFSIR
jgi:hypothetical protein